MKWIIGVLLVLVFMTGCVTKMFEVSEDYCDTDSDCVPSDCCHATSCIYKDKSPACEEVACTMQCEPGTLDCGGKCLCQDNKCIAEIE